VINNNIRFQYNLYDTTTLIVDDEIDVIVELSEGLSSFGLSTIYETSPIQAIKIYTEIPSINFIIVDYKMQEMDGLSFIDEIQNLTNNNNLPNIIMLSGHMNIEIAKKLFKYNVKDLILKPTTIDNVYESIKNTYNNNYINTSDNKDISYHNVNKYNVLEPRNLNNLVMFGIWLNKFLGEAIVKQLFDQGRFNLDLCEESHALYVPKINLDTVNLSLLTSVALISNNLEGGDIITLSTKYIQNYLHLTFNLL